MHGVGQGTSGCTKTKNMLKRLKAGLLLELLLLLVAGWAQTQAVAQSTTSVTSSTATTTRLAGDWQSSSAVALSGSAIPAYRASASLGAATTSQQLTRMLLLLQSSASSQQALTAKLADLQNPSSANYHKWLTPAQFGASFGNSASDVAAVVSWLESQGFTVAALPSSRGWIEFSGTAAQVESAFGAQLQMVSSSLGTRPALTGNITVPSALAPLVTGLVSLDGVIARPALTTTQSVSVTAAELASRTSAVTAEALTPRLLAQLIHLDTLHASGVTGAGATIAIVARGDVQATDVAAFRSAFGLPAQVLTTQPNGVDPGFADDQAAATLAVSWAGAAAPGASMLLVPAAATTATDGVDLALAATVDGALAHTVVVGFSSCEAGLSAAHQAFYQALYLQAAAEGIAVVAATGDAGAAACSVAGSTTPVTSGLAVSGLASTAWNVAAGVTGFSASGAGSTSSALAAWSPASSQDPEYASGGGSSTLYTTPSWQSSLSGSSGYRLLPDVALPAAMDSGVNSGLAFCLSGTTAAGGCSLVRAGGSAAAAAIFGGIAALMDGEHGAQGSLTTRLYQLASTEGVYTDVAHGSSQLACAAGTSGCSTQGVIGYTASTGYDQTTGLGVVNAQTLVTNWVSPMSGTGSVSISLSLSPVESNSTYNPSAAVTLTAQVLSTTGGSTPTGTVTFYDTTTSQSVSLPITLDSTGTATTTLEGVFAVGGNEMVAEYSGDSTYAAATSTPPVNVNTQASTTSLVVTPSATTAAPGDSISVVVTLTVGTPPSGTVNPVGVVTLNVDGGQSTYSAALSTSNGVTTATFSNVLMPSSSSLSSHTLQAVYATNVDYAGSTSPQVVITMTKASPTVTLTANTTTPLPGSTLTLTASIASSSSLQPSGTTSFYIDSALVCTATVSAGSPSSASCSTTAPSVGTHAVTAVYSGDTNFATVTSASLSVTVAKVTPAIALYLASTTPSAGGTDVLTVALTQTSSSSIYPTGSITFQMDGTTVGTAALTSNGTTATYTLTVPASGSHTVQAIYPGDTNFNAVSSTVTTITVGKATTTTTVTPSTTTPAIGATLPVTISVTPASINTALPTGTVTVSVDGVAATVQAVTSSNPATASVTLASLAPGSHTITATYAGDSYYASSTSASVTVTVPKITTTLVATPTATATANTALGVNLTLTPARSYTTLPTGTISLTLDGTSVSTATVVSGSPATATATVPATSMTPGTHVLAAAYAGDTNYATSTSAGTTLTIAKSATTTTLMPSTLTPTAGGSMTVTVSVSTTNPQTALPSGTVTLYEDGVAAGTATLTTGSPSTATVTLSLVSAGTHVLYASYAGDTYYTTSNSSTVSIAAAKGASVTTLTASPTTLTAGTAETLTATVAPASSVSGTTYTLTGSVSFYDGSTLLGTAVVSANTATLSVTLKTNINHSITAIYAGDTNWIGSTSSVLTLSASTLPTTTVLTSNYSTAPPGVAIVLTAIVTPTTVSSTETNPTGLVIFYDGTTVLGTVALAASSSTANTSVAALTTSTLPGGTDSVYAVYQGDNYYTASASNALAITVQDFTITPSSSNPATNLTIVKGSSGSASFDITGLGGFDSLVQVVCAVPTQDYMTCTASPQQVTPPGTVTFVVQTFKTGSPSTSQLAPPTLWPRALGGSALAMVGFLFLPFGRRVRRRLADHGGRGAQRAVLLLLLLLGLAGSGVGCTSSSQVATTGTPLGVSTLTITAMTYVNNTVVTHSVYLTVNVVTSE